MEKLTLGLIITFFIGVMVAVALLPQIAQDTQYMSDKLTITGEGNSFEAAITDGNLTNASYEISLANTYPTDDWRVSDCAMTDFSMTMNNGTAFALTTDYVVDLRAGTYTLVASDLINSTVVGGTENITNSTYTFCGTGYIPDAGGRAIANLILIMAAIALLSFAVWHVMRAKFT